MNWLNLKEKIIVVTGGSSGIGLSIVKELCNQDAIVVNADLRNGDFVHKNLTFIQTDISSKESIDNLVFKVENDFGKVSGLVNNAGINLPAMLVDTSSKESAYEISAEKFNKMVSINQRGVVLLSQSIGRIMVKNHQGVIINVSSESGLEGSEGQSIYAATKAAVNSYTRSWAKELGKFGVRVIGVAPGIMEETGLRTESYEEALAYTRGTTVEKLREGYVQTSSIPLGRVGKLDEVADLVCYLISDRASYITGVTINIAGGKTRG